MANDGSSEEKHEERGERGPNAAQVRLRLFLVAMACWVCAGVCPFVVKATVGRETMVSLAELCACGLSFVCFFIVAASYARGGRFRRHPNSLLVYKTACDAGLCFVVAGVFFYLEVFRCSGGHCLWHGYVRVCDEHAILPFCTQLFAASSELWFLALVVDLRTAVRNPFYSFDASRRLYALGVWAVAVITATVLVAVKHLSGLLYPPALPGGSDDADDYGQKGPVSFRVDSSPYVLDLASCWIRDHGNWQTLGTAKLKWSLFYGPVAIVYAVALATLYVVRQRLARGLSSTFAARVRVAAVSVLTVFTYATYWLVFVGLVAAVYALERAGRRDAAFDIYTVWSFHRLTKCWWDLVVWLLANDPFVMRRAVRCRAQQTTAPAQPISSSSFTGERREPLLPNRRSERLYDDDDVDAPLRPQTNNALQNDVLYYVTSGVRQAARASASARAREDSDRPINLKRRQGKNEIMHLSLATLLALFFVDDDLAALRDRATAKPPSSQRRSPTPPSQAIEETKDDVEETTDHGPLSLPPQLTAIDDFSPSSDESRRPEDRPSSWSTQPPEAVNDGDVLAAARSFDDEDTDLESGSASLVSQRSLARAASSPWGLPLFVTRVVLSTLSCLVPDDLRPHWGRRSSQPSLPFEGDDVGDGQSTTTGDVRRSMDPGNAGAIVFVDHKPQTFRRIREHFGVELEDYVASFGSTQKERFTEGGSSEAFFFYSGDERYMVKTCTEAEFQTLLAIVEAYAAYVCEPANRATFCVRLLGAHCLRLYETAFYFLVMENVLKYFDGGAAMASPTNAARRHFMVPGRPNDLSQARFDIKGSWVNRTMEPPRPGQRLTCRHCNRKYTFGSTSSWWPPRARRASRRTDASAPHASIRRTRGFNPHSTTSRDDASDSVALSPASAARASDAVHHDPYDETFCPVTVGGDHEPNLTLKDNDLNYSHRLRLDPAEAADVVRQLHADARHLASLGIMDFSLLLGIRTVEYPAPVDDGTAAFDRSSFEHGADRASLQSATSTMLPSAAGPHALTCRRCSHVVVREYYYFGIIDILQRWTWKKRLELWWKIHVKGFERDGLSCVPPDEYCTRFQAKMNELLLPEPPAA